MQPPQPGYSQNTGQGAPMPPPQAYPPQQAQAPPQAYPPQQAQAPPQAYPPQQAQAPPQAYPPQQAQAPPQAYPPQQAQAPPQAYPPQQAQALPPATPAPAMPLPPQQPSPTPSMISQLDAIPNEAAKKAKLAMIFYVLSGIIFIGVAGFLMYLFNKAKTDKLFVDEPLMYGFIAVTIVFAAMGFVLAILVKIKVLDSMKDDKWDTAVDMSLFLGVLGFIFALGIGGWFLFNFVNKKMRDHPFYLKTLPPPTPVCERCRQPVSWNTQQSKWYCPNCKIYL